jgi:broad specificity phosphatase PhoE
MALLLTLVRHAQTDWNRDQRYQGGTDTPLSDTGRGQAEAAGRLLAREPFAAVWASPLSRARDTAAAIARPHGLDVRTDPRFGEMRFGAWEGLTGDEVRARFPEAYRQWREKPAAAAWDGAEALADVRARAVAALDALRAEYDGRRVCLVTHGITKRVLILEALGLPLDRLWSFHVSYSGISDLEFREDWAAVHRLNTLAHLDGAPDAVRGLAR